MEHADDLRERLGRLEEAIAFDAHSAERRDQHIAEMSRLLFDLVNRMERLETRLLELGEKVALSDGAGAGGEDDADDRPPHWGRIPGQD